jgi:predicted Ser/Thr protein kinase
MFVSVTAAEVFTAAAYEAIPSPALAATLIASPVIVKIARFEWEIPRLEQETRAYQLLEGSGLAPRFLGHVSEGTE